MQHSTSYSSSTVLNFDNSEFLFLNSKALDFAEICTDYRNLPAFADKYSNKLAFWCQNTVRSLIVLSAQVICVQQMSPPKLFVHQRSRPCPVSERLAKRLSKKISALFELIGKP